MFPKPPNEINFRRGPRKIPSPKNDFIFFLEMGAQSVLERGMDAYRF
jgi:hypothetical protein